MPENILKELQKITFRNLLTFSIQLSPESLMLYHIAASKQEEKLTLSAFIEECIQDVYRTRGLRLELVAINEAK